jgi:hypothetical protein
MSKDNKTKIASLVPQNDDQLAKLLTQITVNQARREGAVAARNERVSIETERLEKEHKWGATIQECDVAIARDMEILETWSAINKDRFGAAKSMTVNGTRFGWRLGNWKTKLLKGFKKWEMVIAALQGIIGKGQAPDAKDKHKERAAMAAEYLAIKVEPNKQAMLRDRGDAERAEFLKEVGIGFDQDEEFYCDPQREEQAPATLTTAAS